MTTQSTEESIRAEYLWLQSTIEDFDKRALTIKTWSVTLSSAGIAAAYAQGAVALFAVVAGAAISVWIVEALWKEHQRAFYKRAHEIEEWSQGGRQELETFRITASWLAEYERTTRSLSLRLRGLLWPHVFLPHALVAVVAVVLFVVHGTVKPI